MPKKIISGIIPRILSKKVISRILIAVLVLGMAYVPGENTYAKKSVPVKTIKVTKPKKKVLKLKKGSKY